MGFTMSQVNRKSVSKKQHICDCLFLINNQLTLTENTKYAIWQYAQYRFNKRNHSTFSAKRLREMVEELLEKILKKSYSEITYSDVYNNENTIIYEIAKAIHYGATKHLYYSKEDSIGVINIDNLTLRDNIQDEPVRLAEGEKLEKQELENYFKGLMI